MSLLLNRLPCYLLPMHELNGFDNLVCLVPAPEEDYIAFVGIDWYSPLLKPGGEQILQSPACRIQQVMVSHCDTWTLRHQHTVTVPLKGQGRFHSCRLEGWGPDAALGLRPKSRPPRRSWSNGSLGRTSEARLPICGENSSQFEQQSIMPDFVEGLYDIHEDCVLAAP